jgi:hypothetical protein
VPTAEEPDASVINVNKDRALKTEKPGSFKTSYVPTKLRDATTEVCDFIACYLFCTVQFSSLIVVQIYILCVSSEHKYVR